MSLGHKIKLYSSELTREGDRIGAHVFVKLLFCTFYILLYLVTTETNQFIMYTCSTAF